jgi:hypothetical protein
VVPLEPGALRPDTRRCEPAKHPLGPGDRQRNTDLQRAQLVEIMVLRRVDRLSGLVPGPPDSALAQVHRERLVASSPFLHLPEHVERIFAAWLPNREQQIRSPEQALGRGPQVAGRHAAPAAQRCLGVEDEQ